jgi:hypothetical protein
MTNQDIIEGFERDRVTEFHHRDHVRLAFAYLTLHAPLEALEKFATALRRFAAARGKAGLYHETITHAYFFLIRERMARGGAIAWEEFARQNEDLLQWKPGILGRYYRESTLQSDLARSVFVFPDKCGDHGAEARWATALSAALKGPLFHGCTPRRASRL